MQALPAQALSFDQWMCMLSCFGRVRLFATLWIVACQTPLSVEFSRQEYWSGLSCPPPWHLLDPGIELLLHLLLWQMGSFTTSTSWEAHPVNALVKIKPMSRYTISSMEERRFSSATLFIFCSWFSLLLVSYYHSLLFITVQFSRSVVSDSLRPRELEHTRPPCPSPTPGVHSNSRPLSQWCHLAISSSVIPFSSCPQSLPASESFPMSQLFASGGQSIGF